MQFVSSALLQARPMKQIRIQLLAYATISAINAVLIGCMLKKSSTEKFAPFKTADCKHGLLTLDEERSDFCCSEEGQGSTWACYSAYEEINRVMTTHWAFVLPLLPLACTTIVDLMNTTVFSTSSVGSSNAWRVLKMTKDRLAYSVFLIFYRTYVLYIGMGILERWWNGHESSVACWYAELMKNKMCKQAFDFSDHIVLYCVQYIVVVSLEIAHVFQSGNVTGYALSLITAILIILFSLRALLFTAMFFHSIEENIAAVLIFLFCVVAPVYCLLARTDYNDGNMRTAK